MTECFACALARGRLPLPGGLIHRTPHWLVEHCVGPLGVGTLVVKPERHVVRLADLTDPEADELGPVLRLAARTVDTLLAPEQVYVGLWSHAGRTPVHIHFVVQPATTDAIEAFGCHGPGLVAAMLERDDLPEPGAVETFAARARDLMGGARAGPHTYRLT